MIKVTIGNPDGKAIKQDVYNIFLQILEDGVLTASDGRKTDFKNSVIIMMSNIGAEFITENKTAIGFASRDDSTENMRRKITDELKKTFCQEFLNRIDETVIFNKMSQETEIL